MTNEFNLTWEEAYECAADTFECYGDMSEPPQTPMEAATWCMTVIQAAKDALKVIGNEL